MTLDELNGMDRAGFVAALGGVFEHGAWVAEAAYERRPFGTVVALHGAMMDCVLQSDAGRQTAFLNGHPELAGGAVLEPHSALEQGGLGLDRLAGEGAGRFSAMNAAYRARFGFPFIICVRRHTRASILGSFERRLGGAVAGERAAALEEIRRITRLRIVGLVEGPGLPRTGGGLSTHVLDHTRGGAAAGVVVELFVLEPEGPELVTTAVTNGDGRAPGGLIPDGEPLRIGRYEVRFHVGAYFARMGDTVAEPAYLDVVPVRIGLADAEAHYHVPLLVTPWTYTTYRGS